MYKGFRRAYPNALGEPLQLEPAKAICQAAKWWHGYYAEQNRQALVGFFHIGHAL
jgi:hypothetical protein